MIAIVSRYDVERAGARPDGHQEAQGHDLGAAAAHHLVEGAQDHAVHGVRGQGGAGQVARSGPRRSPSTSVPSPWPT